MELNFMQLLQGNAEHLGLFTQMLAAYFGEIAPELVGRSGEIAQSIIADTDIPGRHVLAAYAGADAIGFVYASTDLPKLPGYGLIMEFYVASEYRRRGYGSAMARHVERIFAMEAKSMSYLTSDSSGLFWRSLGYVPTGELADWNGDPIYEKPVDL